MCNYVLLLFILIPVAGYLLQRYLEGLNIRMWSDKLPEKLIGICDEKEYHRTQHYYRENLRLSVWSSTLNLAVIIIMLATGGFALIDNIARSLSGNNVVIALIFMGIIGIASELINLPFAWYDTFVIEKKFGFNTMTKRTFITDHLKAWFISLLIGIPVLAIVTWLYYRMDKGFWIYAWLLVTAFTVFINFFYSELIVPLFNKQTPLAESPLRIKIEEFATKTGFRLKNIYIIDGSKRSTKANAYFSGFGSKKRIVLYDTLLREMTDEEIVAVLAHEIGHYRKKHVIRNIISSVLLTGLMLFLFSRIAGNPVLASALGADIPSFHIGLITFGILYSPLSLIIGLLSNYISRQNEFDADRFVKENYDANKLSSALKILSVKNLSNMNPHSAYVFFHYSHPPLLARLEQLE
jgi:STE24 endopeptidase